ncbi:hypothetical protein [Hydrogenophaga sp. R2]|uniref:hypothetical protein n=1 Tax=Hydrogenophaga sp. R2 TaxID=3132827 RepID=UPI003CF36AEC
MNRLVGAGLRAQRKTALLVGEGLAEQAFLNHIKSIYVVRGSKQVSVKTAKGKGGAHVLEHTHRQSLQAAYDQVGALLDTDTDWGDLQRQRARRLGIEIFEATPCLEALLLHTAGLPPPATTPHCKRQFHQRFGCEAHAAELFGQHFSRPLLDSARLRVGTLERLIRFLQT